MAMFTWTAKHKKTGAVGGRVTRHADFDTVEGITGHLQTHFPNVEISDVKLVEEDPLPLPGGAKDHLDARPPTSIGGRLIKVSPIPPEDFQTGAAEAARAEIAQRAAEAHSPE